MGEDTPDFDLYREEILGLHRATIEAHLEKDVGVLVEGVSEGFFSVSKGDVNHPTIEELRSSFGGYLDSTTFTEYRDLREPLIGFSDDGSVAWSVVQVRVAGRTREGGSERDLGFTCAWITLYRRVGEGWVRLGEVSSFK